MATKALITPEQYLSTHFEREPELVHGEIVERPLPSFPHGDIQLELGSRLRALARIHGLFSGVEVRVRIDAELYRIPDIAMWTGPEAPEPVPSEPPVLIVEIASPDDRLHDLLQKFEEYRKWGVPNLWLVEPELKKLYTYDGGLKEALQFELAQFGFAISAAELFA